MNAKRKRVITIEVDEDLAARLEAAGETVPGFLDRQLRRYVPPMADPDASRRWAEENRDALEAHERFIERYGVFSEAMSKFR
ncbi:type II toxin-antitoxin system CcdA family antitoxin [Prosthecomicrobium sp. N25]|uniref:type II toxin-antitoxin system CcdA family antitoxin n=1 Tax=Prosthecomicrobium sp. N25 TaxID=3129254 RepID=UPI003077F2C4